MNLERNMADMDVQKYIADQQTEQYKVQIAELEAQNSSFEVLLKVANEKKMDIAPLRENYLLVRGKIYQVQVKLAEEVFRIKQVESRLQQISILNSKP